MRVEITITAGPAQGQHFVFEESDRFLFGRAADARVSLPHDRYVSRQHFLLEISPPQCKVTDLDSKNGLFVNGVRYGGRKMAGPGIVQAPDGIQSTYLNEGDEIIVGDTRMRVSIQTDIFCVDCGVLISSARKASSAFVGQTYICQACRQKREADATAAEQAGHAGEATHFSYTTDSGRHEVLCIRCHKDVTEEAGARGQVPGAEYVCRTCRERETTGPVELIEKMLNEAVSQQPTQASAEFAVSGYRIEKKIARGGMGIVYKAHEISTKTPVAIKTMLPHVAANPEGIRTFQREIDLTRQLVHPNIVRLRDHGNAEGTFYFILEYVDGPDIYQLMKSRGGTVPLAEAIPLMIATLDGLAYAHQATITMAVSQGQAQTFTGVVHRDLKPQNILLAGRGRHWTPKIADFGTAKSFESAGLTDMTVPGDVLGTPMYWPREQITHYKFLNPATDVFSAAAVFYEMLTGVWVREGFQEMFDRCKQQKRPPSISDYMKVIAGNATVPIRTRNPEIPEPVAAVIDRALQEAEVPHNETKMRDMLMKLRYPHAGAFRDALAQACDQVGILVRQPAEAEDAERREAAIQPATGLSGGFSGNPLDALLEELNLSSEHADIMYSVMLPATSREVALLVLDVEQSSEYIHAFGDTYFSRLIGTIYKQIKNHYLSTDLIFLKTTGDGFLAVFHSLESAYLIASELLYAPPHENISIRIALHWGGVKTGPDGDVLGVEVHRIFRIENVQITDQADTHGKTADLPKSNRILVTSQAMEHLNATDRLGFRLAGKFRLRGFDTLCDLWVQSK